MLKKKIDKALITLDNLNMLLGNPNLFLYVCIIYFCFAICYNNLYGYIPMQQLSGDIASDIFLITSAILGYEYKLVISKKTPLKILRRFNHIIRFPATICLGMVCSTVNSIYVCNLDKIHSSFRFAVATTFIVVYYLACQSGVTILEVFNKRTTKKLSFVSSIESH